MVDLYEDENIIEFWCKSGGLHCKRETERPSTWYVLVRIGAAAGPSGALDMELGVTLKFFNLITALILLIPIDP